MTEYQKIESLYTFDPTIKRFRRKIYNPIVEYLKDNSWCGSEKVDGTNTRVQWDGHSFSFGARTDAGDLPKRIREILSQVFNYDMEVVFEQKFAEKEVILFMEGYGGKVQNGTYLCDEKIIGYDIMVDNIYLDKNTSKQIFEDLGIEFVPLIEFNNLQEAIDYVYNNKQSIIEPESKIEGLVCFPKARVYDHMGNRIIVKIKNKDLNKLVD